MDLEIKHLGQTLAVGGFAVYATLLIIRICRARWIPRFFYAEDGKLQLQHIAVYLALVFAAGIILEDVSKNYAAGRASTLSSILNKILDSDNELRMRSLFKVAECTEDKIRVEPRAIFRELRCVDVRTNTPVATHFAALESLIPGSTSQEPDMVVTGRQHVTHFLAAVNGVFYEAKNRVYREDNYFSELNEISGRIDFTRSLTFLCLIFSIIYLILTILGFIRKTACFLDIERKERLTLLILTLLYGAGIWLAGTAFRSESNNYDMRVFGYYISLNASPDSSSESKASPAQTEAVSHENMNAVLYMKTAAEYRVICRVIYGLAARQMLANRCQPYPQVVLDMTNALAGTSNAVILDIDETFLDNGPYQEEQIVRHHHSFDAQLWREWSESQPNAEVKLVPGAFEFVTNALANDIQIIFITNRREAERPQTLRSLSIAGVDTNRVILLMASNEVAKPSKVERRVSVARQFRLLANVGDDLADFFPVTGSPTARAFEAGKYADHWGASWFLLPNPAYGSWESCLLNSSAGNVVRDKLQYIQGFGN